MVESTVLIYREYFPFILPILSTIYKWKVDVINIDEIRIVLLTETKLHFYAVKHNFLVYILLY